MIQVNLLPDVKLEYLKSNRTKKLVTSTSALVSVGALTVTALLALHVYVNQPLHTKALQTDIDSSVEQLKSIEDLDSILTVNEQLSSLPTLHQNKPDMTRLFDLLNVVVPTDIQLTELTVDFNEMSISFGGTGTSTKAVNTFADILKSTAYSLDDNTVNDEQLAFSSVVFDIGIESQDGVSFDTEMIFSEEIFSSFYNLVDWQVPNAKPVEQEDNENVFEDTEVTP